MLGHDPLSQDTLAHAWPTHYYEIMSLTHQASRVAAKCTHPRGLSRAARDDGVGRRQLVELSELLPAQDRLRLARPGHLVILFRRLLKKQAGFNDEAVKDMIALVEKWRTDAGSRTPLRSTTCHHAEAGVGHDGRLHGEGRQRDDQGG
eukprot:tig00001066_g6754.t1